MLGRYVDFLAPTLGLPIHTEDELARAVEGRFPVTTIEHLREIGLTLAELHVLVLPRRTLEHRRARHEDLTLEESDRVARIGRVVALTTAVLGDRERAVAWLRAPKKRFDDRAPLSLLQTESGARRVEEFLGQIDQGYFA